MSDVIPAITPAAPARPRSLASRIFRRRPWENLATALIACGVVMLMQPFSITLYGWSFATTLLGTAMFIVVSKFPE